MIEHSMASWGTSAKTFSLRSHKGNSFNYPHIYGGNFGSNLYGSAATTKFVIQEIAT